MNISKKEFVNKFTVTYSKPLTFSDIFSLVPIGNRKPIMKSAQDLRYINRDEVVNYFYEIIITNRHKYLTFFYNSYFNFGDPRKMDWQKANIQDAPDVLSLQRNDASRVIVRNLFAIELLHETRITNTCKSSVSFWQTFDNMYNKLLLEDRLFAPSSIAQFLKEKKVRGITEINYNTLYYLIQGYQPKASILNPYAINWVIRNLFSGKRLFTPVLSWGSYLTAFMHTDWTEYMGVDVMPNVCKKVSFLGDYYHKLDPQFINKSVTIRCQPSESLSKDRAFMSKYADYFDAVLLCPPYWTFELYPEGEQSTEKYPDYNVWLKEYWEETVKICKHVLRPGKTFAFIINDYSSLKGEYYPLIDDLNNIAKKYFKPSQQFSFVNRASPLRMNFKVRTEQLCIYTK